MPKKQIDPKIVEEVLARASHPFPENCISIKLLADSLNGIGTSYEGRTPEDFECFHCLGSPEDAKRRKCKQYVPRAYVKN